MKKMAFQKKSDELQTTRHFCNYSSLYDAGWLLIFQAAY